MVGVGVVGGNYGAEGNDTYGFLYFPVVRPSTERDFRVLVSHDACTHVYTCVRERMRLNVADAVVCCMAQMPPSGLNHSFPQQMALS